MKSLLFPLLASLLLDQAVSRAESPSVLLPSPLVFLLEAQPHAAEEGPVAGQLLVVRFGDTNTALEVGYTVSGSAVNEVDYQPLLGRVVIPPGQQLAPIRVTPIDDVLAESRETVVVELTPAAAGRSEYRVQWPGRGVVTIRDNDEQVNLPPQVRLVNPPVGAVFRGPLDLHLAVAADDPDGMVRTVEFFVGESSLGVVSNAFGPTPLPNEGPVSVDFAVAATSAVEVDPAGEALVADSPSLLPMAAFSMVWSNAPVGEHRLRAVATDDRGAVGMSDPVRIRVEADTSLPRVGVVARDATASEPASENELDAATFVIGRTGPTENELAVEIRLAGTAEAGVDYETIASTVIIPAGERQVELTVRPLDDLLEEPRESIVVELREIACAAVYPPPPGCYELASNARAVAWIEDNDQVVTNRPPAVRLARPEPDSVLVAPDRYLLVARAHDLEGHVAQVEFFDGENSLGVVTNRPPITNDGVVVDPVSSLVLPPWSMTWSNITFGPHVLRAVATDDQGAVRSSEPVAIRVVATNVPPLVRLLTPDGVATEPVGAGTSTAEPDVGRFRVVRSGSMDLPLTVFFHVAGSAVNGVDYSAIVGHVTIPAGAEGESIVIRPLADNRVEGPESVVLSLHSPVLTSGDILPPLPYIIGEPSRGQMLLQDADAGNENRPPEVALLRPLAGAVLKRQAEHLIQVHAADRDGFIVRLEAFANDVRIDDQALDPLVAPATGLGGTFLLRWNNALPGEYRLRVRATDNQGASRLSEPVMVRVVEALERTIIDVVAADAEAAEETATAGTEQGDTGLFRLRRRGNLSEPVEVHFQLRGSAVPEKDYRMTETSTAGTSAGAQAAGGAVRFAAGQSEMWLVIRPIDDLLVEPTETVILELSPPICPLIHPPPPGCYQVGEAGRATVFIRDNDEHRNMSPHVAIAGPAPGQQFAAKAEVEIRVQTRDLDGWVSQMEFFVGDRKLGDSVVHFLVPPEPTARQRFSLVWTNVPAGEHVLRARATDNLGAAAWAEPVAIRVREADALPVMDLFARDFRAGETGQNGEVPDTATFVIRRRGSTESPVSVQLEIGGIAQNGVDYETLPTVLTIAAGERLAEIVVRPVDDAEVEPRESVVLRLVPPAAGTTAGYEIGLSARAAAVIVDNDHTVSPPEEERPATARALGDGVVHVVVTGQIAEEVVVEGTDNLLDWYEIARGFMTDGQIDFVEAAVREHAARFYRVVPVSSGLPVVDAQRIFGE